MEATLQLNPPSMMEQTPQFNVSSMMEQTPQFNVSSMMEQTPQFNVSSMMEQTPQFNVSPMMEQTPQLNLSSMMEQTPQFNVSSMMEQTPQFNLPLKMEATQQFNVPKVRSFHNIYCGGPLLEAVQKARLYADCKHFVDMPLKSDAEVTLNKWDELVATGQMDNTILQKFIDENFDQPGVGELEDVQPTDFNPEFESYNAIADPDYRAWARELHKKWPTLCRKVTQKVIDNPQKHSLIPLPNPFVVPGGRFREMYYWDSFFTIKGLLASGMISTARGMIANMGDLIEKYGYVPNGNRVYYLNRSQPPLLAWCLSAYFKATNDKEFIERGLKWLEREYQFFRLNRSFKLDAWPSPLFHYRVVAEGPRPESFREDVECAEHLTNEEDKRRLWGDIAAAAESGRDFSARWFTSEGPVGGKMGSTRTSQIMPVDLNAIMCGNLRTMAELYEVVGQPQPAVECRAEYEAMRECIYQVLWSEENGVWFDYDRVTNRHVACYYDTNFFPLFTGCAHEGFDGNKTAEYLDKAGVLSFPGGLPSSLVSSGQQWDFPNAWAPTTWVVIQGLRAVGQDLLAQKIAEKWIKKNYNMWKSSGGRMFEKYNVESQCFKAMGGGGEYEMQEGFGWTNGVILDLLLTYSDRLSSTTANTCHANCECQTPTQTGSTVDAQSVCEDHPDNTGENVAPVAPLFEGAPVESRPIFSRKTSIFEPKPDAEPLEPLFAQPRSRTNSLSIFNTAAAPFSPMEAPIFEATPLFDRTNPIVEAYDANNQSRSRRESFVGEGFVPRSCTDSFTAADVVPRSRGNSFTTADAPPRSRVNSFTAADVLPRSRVNSFAMPRSRVNSQSVQNGADATPPVEITLPAVMTDELAQSLAATLLSGEVSTSLPQGVDVLPWAESVAPPSFE